MHSNIFTVNPHYTLIIAVLVILLGHYITQRVEFLRRYSIPEPVTGGLIVAIVLLLLHHYYGLELRFNEVLKNLCMVTFFASVGLSANLKSLAKGGRPLMMFLCVIAVFVILQDVVGVAAASLLPPLKPLSGLLLGSIPLSGGHSTAGSWGPWFETHYHLQGAAAMSIAAATYGLIAGGILGGPLTSLLLKKTTLPTKEQIAQREKEEQESFIPYGGQERTRLITSMSTLEVLAMFALCLSVSYFLTDLINVHFPDSKFRIPSFVWALLTGIVVRNVLTHAFNYEVFERNIDVLGNVSLYLFLALALISLRLWDLSGLSGVVIIVLLIQTLFIALFLYFVTFPLMGKDYDAAIICAGQCGFGLGATPTAIANIQALTEHFGPSPRAFLLVPLVGAFFIDLINAVVLSFFQYFLTT